jgi:LysR family cys regulon transcriptional activator
MLIDAANLSEIGSRLAAQDEGTLRIVTTHTQARYSLPPIIARFKQAFPNVRLALNQASPRDIAGILLEGDTMENTSGCSPR